jgi:hypothetical protein
VNARLGRNGRLQFSALLRPFTAALNEISRATGLLPRENFLRFGLSSARVSRQPASFIDAKAVFRANG